MTDTTSTVQLDGEVVGLLEEIAKDPRSRLFGHRPRREVTSAQPMTPLSWAMGGWSPAERDLIRAHREQVAYHLARWVIVLGCQDKDATSDTIDLQNVPDRDWFRNIERLKDAGRGCPVTTTLSVLRGESARPPSLATLTEDLMSLRPSETSKNLHGWALLMDGAFEEARQSLGSLHEETRSDEVGYWAALNLSYAYYRLGDLEAEVDCLLAALRHRATTQAASTLMVEAARLGELRVARLAATVLEDISGPDDPALMAYVRILQTKQDRIEQLRSLESGAGPLAGRIIDAALH